MVDRDGTARERIWDVEVIEIPPFELAWGDWVPWAELKRDGRIPPKPRAPGDYPGVYEVRYLDSASRLYIGRAANLRMRVKQGLVKGKLPHDAGRKIREMENLALIVVRWATCARPAAAEEELHLRHLSEFKVMPKYTEMT